MKITDAFNHNFCVYAHRHGKRIIYIGYGSLPTAFTRRRSARWERMTGKRKITVEIMGRFQHRYEAHKLAIELVREHAPYCNSAMDGEPI